MTKRQWFLVAGTIVLAACNGNVGPCETNEETLETSNCPGLQAIEPGQPSQSLDVPDPDPI